MVGSGQAESGGKPGIDDMNKVFPSAAAAVAAHGVPLLGVNLGKIGFLARSESFQLAGALPDGHLEAGWPPLTRIQCQRHCLI